MNKKVSVIVAVYKSEPFLEKCIESISNQSYDNLEIILVDDGSPDNSGKICDDWAKKDKRIKVIHKKNGGACEARNFGLKEATGEYISIIDGDDWLSLDYIEYLMNIVDKYNCDMAMTDSIFTTRNQIQNEIDNIRLWTSEEALTNIIYPVIPIGPWNKIYRKKLLDDNNITFCVSWSGEGLHFSSTAAQYSNCIGVGHRKIYNYRLNNVNSGLTNYNVQMGTNAYENIRLIRDQLIIKTPKVYNAINWHIWSNYNFILKLIYATNSKKENYKLYRECIVNIRRMMLKTALHVEMPLKSKILIIIKSLFPRTIAKRSVKIEKQKLKKDLMK